jgi:hypothetical protein
MNNPNYELHCRGENGVWYLTRDEAEARQQELAQLDGTFSDVSGA